LFPLSAVLTYIFGVPVLRTKVPGKLDTFVRKAVPVRV
jgi:hypothetical protein